MTDLARTARLDILVEGYARRPHVAGTVSLIRDAGRVIVVAPGMVADRDLILRPLRELGVRPQDITDIVISHHHPDHTVNIALFPMVPVHDFQWVIRGDVIETRDADGLELTPSVGCSPRRVTHRRTSPPWSALPRTSTRSPACGGRPRARRTIRTRPIVSCSGSRGSGSSLWPRVVPGHGAAFRPGGSTPR